MNLSQDIMIPEFQGDERLEIKSHNTKNRKNISFVQSKKDFDLTMRALLVGELVLMEPSN